MSVSEGNTSRHPRKRGRALRLKNGAERSLSERVRGILATKSLSVYEVAAISRAKYSSNKRFHVPGNLYFQLRSARWTPTLEQVFALSEVSGYRFADWLAVFGFPLDKISRAQLQLFCPRTVLLDATLYDPRAEVPWFVERSEGTSVPPIAPLSQLLERSGSLQISSVGPPKPNSYLYAKIGTQDALVFPELVPGSVVRVNPQLLVRSTRVANGENPRRIFLLEHRRGFCCSRLHFGSRNRVTLLPTQLPFANMEFELGSEARLLGIVDLEIRPLLNLRRSAPNTCTLPEVADELTRLWTPSLLDSGMVAGRASRLLCDARLRAGLTFHHASELSRVIAELFHNQRYFTSPGSLSDYEASDAPPRHIHKLLTLSILYSVRFAKIASAYGLLMEEGGSFAIPDEWRTSASTHAFEKQRATTRDTLSKRGFLAGLLERFGEFPLFLGNSLDLLSGLPELSLHDVFWVGGQPIAPHPSLDGALFVAVDRRSRKLLPVPRKSSTEPPLYLLTKRDNSYQLASCSLQNSTIIVHPQAGSLVRPEHFRLRIDAEVIGQVVAVVRSLPDLS
jgi:hypothetical protein